MRSLVITLAALFATSALSEANINTYLGTYQSQGTWKDSTGKQDTWSSELTFTHEETSNPDEPIIVYYEKLSIQMDGETIESEETIKLHHRGQQFFDIKIDEEIVGTAYCYGNSCHFAYHKGDEKHEETLLFDDSFTQIARMGSGIGPEHRFAFRGVSTRRSE